MFIYSICKQHINKINIQLFGIAVILAGGFVLVAETTGVGWPDRYLGYWVVLLGLGISLISAFEGFFVESVPPEER